MTNTNGIAEDVQATVRNTTDRASDKLRQVGDKASETFHKASDKVNEAVTNGFKTARQFAQTAQKYVEDSGIGDVDVREVVQREPWVSLGVAFALGYVAAQITRRMS
jgi:ElaB/YqjD/DUF883 family membrane-anchored ribosome-binding protein